MSLRWKGKEVADRVVRATMEAVDDTTAAAVRHAKRRVPVKTATLQGSIEARPAQFRRNIVSAFWGSFEALYAIFVETGTSRMAAQPYLRPAADREYRRLRGRIRTRLKAMGKV